MVEVSEIDQGYGTDLANQSAHNWYEGIGQQSEEGTDTKPDQDIPIRNVIQSLFDQSQGYLHQYCDGDHPDDRKEKFVQ